MSFERVHEGTCGHKRRSKSPTESDDFSQKLMMQFWRSQRELISMNTAVCSDYFDSHVRVDTIH